MRMDGIVALLVSVHFFSGCSKPVPPKPTEPEPQNAALEEHAERLDKLEEGQREILDRLDDLRVSVATGRPAARTNAPRVIAGSPVDAAFVSNTAEQVHAQVVALVQAAIDERIGDQETVQDVFEEVVQEEIAALEERKQKEEEEEQERRREERDRQRAEWEERQFTSFADNLALSDEQREAVKYVRDETRTAMRDTMSEMREEGSYTPGDYREVFTLIRSNENAVMQKLLTEGQYNTFTNEYHGHIGGGFGGRGSWGGRR